MLADVPVGTREHNPGVGMKFSGTKSYVATDDLKVAVNAAITLERPLLVKGEPGTGKTVLALEVAEAIGAPILEWHIKSTTKAQQGLYEYDAVSRLRDSQLGDEKVKDIANYIRRGKLWDAFEMDKRPVLLIDEIDKADIEFPNDLLQELDRMARRGAKLLRQLVSRMALRRQSHEHRDGRGVDIERTHDAQHLGHFVLVIEGDRPYAILFERKANVGLRLDGVHVEQFAIGFRTACGNELLRRSDIEGADTRRHEIFQNRRLAVCLHRISGLARENRQEPLCVLLKDLRPETIDRNIGTQIIDRLTGIPVSLHFPFPCYLR